MRLTEPAFANKALLYFLLTAIVISGIWSFGKMSKLEDPEIKVKQAMVITKYPGASAHEVELEVTDILEKEIRSMGDLEEITSRSLANFSEITVHLKTTTPDNEVEQKWDLLRRKVNNAKLKLPEEAFDPVVLDDFGDVYGMFYALTSDGYDYEEMNRYAKMIQNELLSVESVKKVEIYGYRNSSVNIYISENKIAKLGVHPAEILLTLKSQNKKVYPGNFDAKSEKIRISVNDQLKTIEDIQNLIIQGHEADQIKLKDIAEVKKEAESPYNRIMRHNGKPALGISISMESGGNIINLGKEIEKRLQELKSRIPAGLEMEKIFFQPEKVENSINQFLINLVESVAIVILVLMFTMGLRSGILIGSGLVLSILGSFPVLFIAGGTLQRVSLASFIIAMGMLVDNSIVVVDGILVDLQHKMPRKKALLNTPDKTAIPLLGATLMAIFAFLPVFLSPDTAGTYTRDLFIVLAVSLLFSWILSITQIPVFSEKFLTLKSKHEDTKPHDNKVHRLFRSSLIWSMNHRFMTILIALLLLASSLYCFRFLQRAFFPDFVYNQVYIEYKLPEGTSIDQVNSDLINISSDLRAMKEVTNVTSSLSSTPSRYNLVRRMAHVSTSYGELIVDFTDYKTLLKVKPKIQKYFEENYPSAEIRINHYNLIVLTDYLVEVLFTGPDPAVLRSLSEKAENIMRKNPKVGIVRNNWEPKTKQIIADYSQPLARKAGISRSDISYSILAATDGFPVGNFYCGGEIFPMKLRIMNADGSKIGNLKDIPVWSIGLPHIPVSELLRREIPLNEFKENLIGSVPLAQVTKSVKTEWAEPLIQRYNGERAILAQCDPAPGYKAEEVRSEILDEINSIELPEGYNMIWKGEYYNQTQAMKYIKMFLPVAVILLVIMLILMFKDFKKPLVILLCIPLAVIGMVYGMLITGKLFGFVSIVGAIGLMGMMIKNGVVLIEEIELEIKAGVDAYKAVIESSVARMRPVMMASLTTILGMIPLINDPMFGSMAVTIMGGLSVGTVITLVFLPVLYTVFFKITPPKEG
ncbi:MAG: multidrug transporter AcrB [Candidatus Cloacimonadota bacterium]|nr:MAG: multidrug transporter AcrB [Candidatus Cloacimonadota bacterium]